jgi:hypothetical protein
MEKAKQAIFNNIPRLFHYQEYDAERLKDTLLNNRVYCSNPVDFNDPWDMKPLVKTLDNEQDRNEYIAYVRKTMIENGMSQEIMDELLNVPSLIESLSEKNTLSHWKTFEEYFRVYCLTPKPDNLLMWSHYAKKHQGICLEFNTDNPIFGSAWKVEYHSEYPYYSWKPEFYVVRLALTKAKCWEYEEEYRILPKTVHADKTLQQEKLMLVDDSNKLIFPAEALKSIIIGCKANHEEIKNLIQTLRPELKVKHAIMQHNRYGINIE